MSDTPLRCGVCGWTFAKSRDEGCVPGDCSMRPVPKQTAHERSLIRVTCERDAALARAERAEATMIAQVDHDTAERVTLINEMDTLRAQLAAVTKERDTVAAHRAIVERERDEAIAERDEARKYAATHHEECVIGEMALRERAEKAEELIFAYAWSRHGGMMPSNAESSAHADLIEYGRKLLADRKAAL